MEIDQVHGFEGAIDTLKVRYCTVPFRTKEFILSTFRQPLPLYRITLTMADYSKVTYFGTRDNLKDIWHDCQRNQTVFEGTKVSTTSYETEGKNGTYVVYDH